MKRILAGLVLIITFSLHAQQTVVNNTPKVSTASGIVRGGAEGDVESFK